VAKGKRSIHFAGYFTYTHSKIISAQDVHTILFLSGVSFSFLKEYLVYGCSFEDCYLVEHFRL